MCFLLQTSTVGFHNRFQPRTQTIPLANRLPPRLAAFDTLQAVRIKLSQSDAAILLRRSKNKHSKKKVSLSIPVMCLIVSLRFRSFAKS